MRHQDLLDSFIRYVGLTRSADTQHYYLGKIRPLLKHWSDLEPWDFTKTAFEDYLAWGKAEKDWKPRTIQMLLTAAKAFIAYHQERKVPMPDFIDGIKRPRSHRSKPEFYTPDEITVLLQHTRGHRMELVIAMAFYGGMRNGEIRRAYWSDVDFDANTITVHGNKTGKDRCVPLAPVLREVLKRHGKGAGKKTLIVDWENMRWNCSRSLKTICKRAGVEYKSIHKARHGFATTLLSRGVDVVTARDLLGHTSINTTNIYSHTTPDRMKAAVDVL